MDGADGFIRLEEDCGAWQDFDASEVVKIHYKTAENACKAEIFVDGIFQYSGGTVSDGKIQLKI